MISQLYRDKFEDRESNIWFLHLSTIYLLYCKSHIETYLRRSLPITSKSISQQQMEPYIIAKSVRKNDVKIIGLLVYYTLSILVNSSLALKTEFNEFFFYLEQIKENVRHLESYSLIQRPLAQMSILGLSTMEISGRRCERALYMYSYIVASLIFI